MLANAELGRSAFNLILFQAESQLASRTQTLPAECKIEREAQWASARSTLRQIPNEVAGAEYLRLRFLLFKGREFIPGSVFLDQ